MALGISKCLIMFKREESHCRNWMGNLLIESDWWTEPHRLQVFGSSNNSEQLPYWGQQVGGEIET